MATPTMSTVAQGRADGAPEWVKRQTSGAKYYVKLDSNDARPLHSTWSRPEIFAKLNREFAAMTEDEWYDDDVFDEEVDEVDEGDDES